MPEAPLPDPYGRERQQERIRERQADREEAMRLARARKARNWNHYLHSTAAAGMSAQESAEWSANLARYRETRRAMDYLDSLGRGAPERGDDAA